MTKAVSAKLMLRNFICPSMTWPDLITGPVALNAAIIAEHDEVELPRTVILRADSIGEGGTTWLSQSLPSTTKRPLGPGE
jgi:hypothetical protein